MADACTCEFGYSENVEIIYRSLEASAEFDCIVSATNSLVRWMGARMLNISGKVLPIVCEAFGWRASRPRHQGTILMRILLNLYR